MPWPRHLPSKCDQCSHQYDLRRDLELGPGKLGRFLQKHTLLIAGLSLVLFLVLANLLGMERLTHQGNKAIIILAVISPTLIVMILRTTLPAKARLSCPMCGSQRFVDLPR